MVKKNAVKDTVCDQRSKNRVLEDEILINCNICVFKLHVEKKCSFIHHFAVIS